MKQENIILNKSFALSTDTIDTGNSIFPNDELPLNILRNIDMLKTQYKYLLIQAGMDEKIALTQKFIERKKVELEMRMITKLFSINLGEYNYTSINNAHHSSNRVGGLFLFKGIFL